MMVINNKFEIGETVYLKTDSDQRQRFVTRIMVAGSGYLLYELFSGSTGCWHYDFEISTEKDVLKATSE